MKTLSLNDLKRISHLLTKRQLVALLQRVEG